MNTVALCTEKKLFQSLGYFVVVLYSATKYFFCLCMNIQNKERKQDKNILDSCKIFSLFHCPLV